MNFKFPGTFHLFVSLVLLTIAEGYWPPRQNTGRSEAYVDKELEAAKARAVQCDCPRNAVILPSKKNKFVKNCGFHN